MANKKISELQSRTPALSDLMLVGDPSSGYSYKCTVTALATIIETDIADGFVTIGTTQTVSGAKTFSNNLTLTSVANTPTDPDKFLTLNASNVVTYRTGAEVLSDIGGQGTITLTTTGTSGAATLVGSTLNIPNYGSALSGYVPYTGATTTVDLNTRLISAGYSQIVGDNTSSGGYLGFKQFSGASSGATGYTSFFVQGTTTLGISFSQSAGVVRTAFLSSSLISNNTAYYYNFPNKGGTFALLDDVTGAVSGTTNYIPKFTSSSAIGNSSIIDNTLNVTISKSDAVNDIGLNVQQTANGTASYLNLISNNDGGAAYNFIRSSTNGGTNHWQIGGGGSASTMVLYTSGSERLRISSTGNVSIGNTNNTYKLDVTGKGLFENNANAAQQLIIKNTTAGANSEAYLYIISDASAGSATLGKFSSSTTPYKIIGAGNAYLYNGTLGDIAIINDYASGAIKMSAGGSSTAQLTLDASGNLGLGVSPSAWSSSYRAIQVGNSGSIFSATGTGGDVYISSNSYLASGGNTYINTNFASDYYQFQGQHIWRTAPSGTAGNAISFTQAMTLDASGRLGIGQTSPTFLLDLYRASNAIIRVLDGGTNNSLIMQAGSGTGMKITGYNYTTSTAVPVYISVDGANTILQSGGGNVGIGTTSPQTILDAAGTIRATNTNIPSSGVGLEMRFSTGDDRGEIHAYNRNTGTAKPLYLSFSGANTLIGGNVGIGTTSPNVNLVVSNAGAAGFEFNPNSAGLAQIETYNRTTAAYVGFRINADDIRFHTGASATERMRITSGGQVGIANTIAATMDANNGSGTLVVGSGSGSQGMTIYSGSTSGNEARLTFANASTGSGSYSAQMTFKSGDNAILFYNQNAERMRITSAGNVGIGTSTPDIYSYGGNRSFLTLLASATNQEPFLQLIANGTGNSLIDFGNATIRRATILGFDGSHLGFYTNGTNSGTSVSERMRITSGGDILVGITSTFTNARYQSENITGPKAAMALRAQATSGSTLIEFWNPNGQVGAINTSGTATSFVTSSDYRLKQDLKTFNGLSLIDSINVYDYQWKSDSTRSYGVMAHELQSVLSYAVSGVKDGKDMQGVDYSKLVPILIQSIKELKAELQILKNK